MKTGKLFIFSGPSQIGKDTIVRQLRQDQRLNLAHVITNTTRARRPGERQDITYHFVTEPEFKGFISGGKLLEWARVRNAYFGTPKQPVETALASGKNVILQIDVQGALQVKAKLPATVLIFVTAESTAEVRNRIFRSTRMTEAQKADRWHEAQRELELKPRYQHVLVNRLGQLGDTLRQAKAIVLNELRKPAPQGGLTPKPKLGTLRKRS